MWIDMEQCTDSTESRQLSAHTKLRHVGGNRTYRRRSTAAASPASYTRPVAANPIYRLWVCARDDTFDIKDDSSNRGNADAGLYSPSTETALTFDPTADQEHDNK
ncbi:hypothetical protein EYF80_055947 [Liparis tanakae]|uniref:Uncharacterized protein n=1 Tax=Liparis tanakae TaxID=230148 RepID=A0A4Z2EYC2_9TELE|nr:hypothetical protein EYF80_055947 [Liparis tanakae]